MKVQDIKLLIEKFYNGETSIHEEQLLKDYFDQKDIPEQFSDTKEYFNFLQKEASLELDDDFDDKFFKEAGLDEHHSNNKRIWMYRISGIAATILVFVLVWIGTELLQPKEVYGTISDPAIAFLETQKAMDEVSKKMNMGLKPAEKTVKTIDNSVKKIEEFKKMNKALENTKSIHKIDKASDLLKSISKVYISYGEL